MKKGEVYTGTVERMDFPNRGIVTIDGETAVVKNALPGQVVTFAVNKKRGGRFEGRLLQVEKDSPLEKTEGRCAHFGVCGGCLCQSLPYEEQLKIKEAQIRRLMDGVCQGDYSFEGILGSPLPEGYRNKMEFSFGDAYKGGPLELGMHRRGSFHDVVSAEGCRIVHEDFSCILAETRAYFADLGVGFYRKLQHTGYLRHLLVRRAVKTGEILTALVTTGQNGLLPANPGENAEEAERRILEEWEQRLRKLPLEGHFAGILHIRNDSLADVVRSDETRILYGQDFFYEELLGLKFRITPFSFFQTNSLGAEVLYETVREYVGGDRKRVVFDLYSGTGTIAQVLAPAADRVVGVEIVEEAVQAARENAAENGLENCGFIAGDVLKVLDELTEKPDFIVLDPPRDGIHPKALDKILDFGVERMVYISCKPTSLARDLIVMQQRGYRVSRMRCVDMFPGTGNCEVVALVVR